MHTHIVVLLALSLTIPVVAADDPCLQTAEPECFVQGAGETTSELQAMPQNAADSLEGAPEELIARLNAPLERELGQAWTDPEGWAEMWHSEYIPHLLAAEGTRDFLDELSGQVVDFADENVERTTVAVEETVDFGTTLVEDHVLP